MADTCDGVKRTWDEGEAQGYLTTVEDPVQRAAATRALIMWQTNESEVLPALIARLDDEQVAVRRLAIDALAAR